jgi:thiamine-phosphate pyrophosphorylase
MGSTFVSCSAHSVDEAVERSKQGPDAVLLSPIFVSPGKGEPLGLDALMLARRRVLPAVALIALGGVDQENARAAIASGADGVAGIRADLTGILLSPVR